MGYKIKNRSILNKLLWLDFILGASSSQAGLIFTIVLTKIFSLSFNLIFTISVITFAYSIVAFILTQQKIPSLVLLRILIKANWIWAIISVVLLYLHFENATIIGRTFLSLQVLVVGGLAYLEGNQIIKEN